MVARHVEENSTLDLSRLPSGRLKKSFTPAGYFIPPIPEPVQMASSGMQQGG
jgi:hypothetical protein